MGCGFWRILDLLVGCLRRDVVCVLVVLMLCCLVFGLVLFVLMVVQLACILLFGRLCICCVVLLFVGFILCSFCGFLFVLRSSCTNYCLAVCRVVTLVGLA